MRTIVTECNFDIMGICETFLDDNVADNEICIEGYTTVKKNRNRHGGGVILYIKEGIQYNEITNLAGSEAESVWANIQCDKQQLALGIMYRPPSSNHAYLKSMLDQIDNVYSYNENVILMGDLNYDYKLDESFSSNPLHRIEILYGMRQLINSPTRVTLTTSTIIDVMFSTEHESHVVTGVYDISLSDHYMTYTIYSKNSHKTCLPKEINFRNYKRFNIDSFRNALSQNDNICNTSWSADQLADKWNKFKDGFIKTRRSFPRLLPVHTPDSRWRRAWLYENFAPSIVVFCNCLTYRLRTNSGHGESTTHLESTWQVPVGKIKNQKCQRR